jgi:Tol biopolymer transport system component
MIAYLEISDSSKDLYVINPDGTGDRLVRSGIGWFEVNEAETLAWTPNGQEIVFVTNRARINAIEVSTGDMRVLLDYSNDIPQVTRAPVISSQGMLAFVRDQVYLAQLTFDEFGLVEVDETSIVNLPPVGFPRGFSPDGSYLAFNGWNDATGWEVGVLDLVTLEETVVFQGGNGVSRVSWSPDGSQIATHGPTPGSASWSQDLYRITNWNDSPNRQVIRVTNTDGFKNHEISLSWNPSWIEL